VEDNDHGLRRGRNVKLRQIEHLTSLFRDLRESQKNRLQVRGIFLEKTQFEGNAMILLDESEKHLHDGNVHPYGTRNLECPIPHSFAIVDEPIDQARCRILVG